MEAHKVTVGSDTHSIGRFKGYKAMRAAGIVAGILQEVGDLGEEMVKVATRLEQENSVVLERPAFELQYGATKRVADPDRPEDEEAYIEVPLITDEAWEANGNKITLPGDAPTEALIASVFPKVFDAAEERVMTLLALMVTPDRTLEEKDDEGGREAVDEFLKGEGKKMLHAGYFDELAELVAVSAEAIQEQLSGELRDRLGAALRPFLRQAKEDNETPTLDAPTDEESPADDEEEQETSPEETPKTPSSTPKQPSSTDSEVPTDGTEERSSSAMTGASSSASMTG